MLSSRALRGGVKLLHNGKGRPIARKYSQLLASGKVDLAPQSARSTKRVQPSYLPLRVKTLQSHRHASTSPSAAPEQMLDSGLVPSASPSDSEWNALFKDASATHPVNMEPHIGWLKEIGLNYGFGPTTLMETIFEYVHVYSGLPFWGAMLATAYGTRLLILRYHVKSSDTAARMAQLQDVLKPLQEKMRHASAAGDSIAQTEATKEMRATMAAAGVRPMRMFAPIIFQGILGYGMFRLINGMSRLPVPGFEHGGLLWFTDLTMKDPYFVLPVASGLILWYTVKRGGEAGMATMQPGMMKVMLYVLPSLTTLIFINLPAGTQFLAFITSTWSMFQGRILRSPRLREMLGITPLPVTRRPFGAAEPQTPYQGTVSSYRTPEEIARAASLKSRWARFRQPLTDYYKQRTKGKPAPRLNSKDLDKARQYEKERRAEIDAAKERYLKDQRRKGR